MASSSPPAVSQPDSRETSVLVSDTTLNNTSNINNSSLLPDTSASADIRISRSNNVILISQAEVIDRELAYKQRLNRPFKVIQHLPLSKEPANYDLLEHPLSVKDSASLTNSLIVSRHNWLYNVFKSFWTRREQYINVISDRRRDKMSKLCDLKMVGGPHTFDIRIFILKDEEKERKYQQELDRKREDKLKKSMVKEEELKDSLTKTQQELENIQKRLSAEGDEDMIMSESIPITANMECPGKQDPTIITSNTENDTDSIMTDASNVKPIASELTQTSLKTTGDNPATEIESIPRISNTSNPVITEYATSEEPVIKTETNEDPVATAIPSESETKDQKESSKDSVNISTPEKETPKEGAEKNPVKDTTNPTDITLEEPVEDTPITDTSKVAEAQDQEFNEVEQPKATDPKQNLLTESEHEPEPEQYKSSEATPPENGPESKEEPGIKDEMTEFKPKTPTVGKDPELQNLNGESRLTISIPAEPKAVTDDSSETSTPTSKPEVLSPTDTPTSTLTTAPIATTSAPANGPSNPIPKPAETHTTTPTPTSTPPPPPKATSDLMANPENAIMIHNLNTIARSDEHLSSLMKTVASGGASSAEIAEFQQYIHKARQMGDVDGIYKKMKKEEEFQKRENLKNQQLALSKQIEQDRINKERLRKEREAMKLERERLRAEKERLRVEKDRAKMQQRQEKIEQKRREKEEKENKKRLLREEKEREREQKRLEKLRREEEREEKRLRFERMREQTRVQLTAQEQAALTEKIERDRADRAEKERLKEEKRELKEREKRRLILERKSDKTAVMDDKLSAFQDRYAKDATLIFEYQENTSARFYIPKDSIIEIVGDDQLMEEARPNSEVQQLRPSSEAQPQDLKQEDNVVEIPPPTLTVNKSKRKPYVEILISFIKIHNELEIEAYENRKKRELEEIQRKEEEERKAKELAEKETVEEEQAEESKSFNKKKRKAKKNWSSSRRATRQTKPVVEETIGLTPEPGEEDIKPTPVYSTTTIKLLDVPVKFADLIKNSANPLPEVQRKFQDILANGERLTRSHVWYQLDGIKDELLAETLRFNLNRLDYINGGGKLKGKAMLKRIVEKTGSEVEVIQKRQRK